jgi:hypothetical protein
MEWTLRLSRQRQIGSALYSAVFGPDGLGDPGRWLHIVPVLSPTAGLDENEQFLSFICRIPWALLTREHGPNARFLVLDEVEPVAVTIDAAPDRANPDWFRSVKLPPYPRLLLVIPQVQTGQPTQGDVHSEELLAALVPYYGQAGLADHIRVVRTFAEFQQALRSRVLDPHIIYFYGHGRTSGFGTFFEFQNDNRLPDPRGLDEVRGDLDALVQRTRFPPLFG